MAELFRVTKLNDQSQNQIFTFLLPPATCSDTPPEISSRDFSYAGHRWRLSLFKKDKHLSPYLVCTNLARGLRCCLDFTLVLVNRESFTQNESFTDKQKFFENCHTTGANATHHPSEHVASLTGNASKQNPVAHEPTNSHGRRTFITLTDLKQRKFADDRGNFLLEVTMKNPRSTFEYNFQLNKPRFDPIKSNAVPLDYQRYDSTVFMHGDMEWHCIFCPNMEVSEEGKLRHMVQIVRKNKTQLLCKLSYKLTLGSTIFSNKNAVISFRRQEIFDFAGNGQSAPIYFDRDYCSLLDDNDRLKLTIDLFGLTVLNHVKFAVQDGEPTGGTARSAPNSPKNLSSSVRNSSMTQKCAKSNVQTFSDKDKQTWFLSIVPKFSIQDFLTFSLVYADCQNIPKNYCRYVSWNVSILPADKTKNLASIHPLSKKSSSPAFENFYTQMFADKGYPICMDTKAQELKDNAVDWLDELENRFTVEIEWLSSYLLFQPFYSTNDDVYRKHTVQMRREISALQLENGDLERELFKYQISAGKKFSSNDGSLDQKNGAAIQTGLTPRSRSMVSGETDRRLFRKTHLGELNMREGSLK